MLSSSFSLLLLTVCLTASCLQPSHAQTAAAATGAKPGAAVCTLSIVGYGAGRPDIKSASLSCSGGRTITVVPHKVLREFWAGQKYTPPGVVLGDTACSVSASGNCLLHVCGQSNAVFTSATVTDLQGGSVYSDLPLWHIAICVRNQSTITFRNSRFTFLKETLPLLAKDDTSVLL